MEENNNNLQNNGNCDNNNLNSDFVFCKIIRGETPCFKIYENEHVLAFLDIRPVSQGHTIIIPKKHIKNYFDIEGELFSKINNSLKIVKNKLKIFNKKNIFYFIIGFDIDHAHIHLVPANDMIELNNFKNQDIPMVELENTYKKIMEDEI